MSMRDVAARAVAAAAEAPDAPPSWLVVCLRRAAMAYKLAVSRTFAFANCNEAAAAFKAAAEHDEASGWTSWPHRFRPEEEEQNVPLLNYPNYVTRPNGDGTYTCTGTVRFAANPNVIVSLPAWPSASGADKDAWDRMIAALRVHEEGHVKLPQCYAEELGTITLPATTGRTRAEAAAAMDAQIRARAEQAQAELDKSHAAYDKLTKSGRNQSALGGENVILDCQHGAAQASASP